VSLYDVGPLQRLLERRGRAAQQSMRRWWALLPTDIACHGLPLALLSADLALTGDRNCAE
jgi:hypothetical protein